MTRTLAAILLLATLPAAAAAQEPPPVPTGEEIVLELGQEAIIDRALSDAEDPYPAGCTFKTAAVGTSLVIASFDCDGQKADVRLRHVQDKTEPGIETNHFVISRDENLPPTVHEAVAERIRNSESQLSFIRRKDMDMSQFKGPEQPVELLEAQEHLEAGRADRALTIVLDLMRVSPSTSVSGALINVLVQDGIDEERARVLLQRADNAPDDPAQQYAAGMAAALAAEQYGVGVDRHKELHRLAVKHLDPIKSGFVGDVNLHKQLAESHWVAGNQEEAEKHIERALALDADESFPQLYLTRARLRQFTSPTDAAADVERYLGMVAELAAANPNISEDPESVQRLMETADLLRDGGVPKRDVFFDRTLFDDNPWWYMLDYPALALGALLLGFGLWRVFRGKGGKAAAGSGTDDGDGAEG